MEMISIKKLPMNFIALEFIFLLHFYMNSLKVPQMGKITSVLQFKIFAGLQNYMPYFVGWKHFNTL